MQKLLALTHNSVNGPASIGLNNKRKRNSFGWTLEVIRSVRAHTLGQRAYKINVLVQMGLRTFAVILYTHTGRHTLSGRTNEEYNETKTHLKIYYSVSNSFCVILTEFTIH